MHDGALVFVSYSREDAEWRRRFAQMLKPVVRERRLQVWSDERVLVGEQWRPQLADAITRSRAALLLVTPAFLDSDFIMEQEVPALLERGARLVPVLVRHALWEQVSLLEQLQWAHDPGRDGPVSTSADPEGQIVRVCRQLLQLLPGNDDRSEPLAPSLSDPTSVTALEPVQHPGALHGVPPLPTGYVARDELAELRRLLVAAPGGAVGITGNAQALGLHGQGGIGKTVVAAALAADDEVRRHFPDGIFWVTAGEHGNLVTAQLELLERLGVAHPELRSTTEGLALLREALTDRRCLLIVDDVWSTAAAAAFRATGPRGRVLYTTRDRGVLGGVGAHVESIGVLSHEAARQLLALLAAQPAAALPPAADRILELTGRGALALSLVGAAVGRGGYDWPDAVTRLERGSQTFLDHPYANAFKAMQVGVESLDATLAGRYRSLAVFPEHTVVPVAAVVRYWGHLWGATRDEVVERLETLATQGLLAFEDDGFTLHDLQRDFLLLGASEMSLAHADLLAAYSGLLPEGEAWSALPRDEPYIWEHLVYHLRGAGDAAGIVGTVTDLRFLAVRTFRAGPYAAEGDLRQAADLAREPATEWLLRLFTQWGHLFAGHRTLGDLAATIASRTRDAPAPIDPRELVALLPARFLQARWGLPEASAALARVLEGHSGSVFGVAFSSDGRHLVSAGQDRAVRLWDVVTGEPAGTLAGHSRGILTVAPSPDGRLVASGGLDREVRLWELVSGRPAGTLSDHHGSVDAVAFAPDGALLASAGEDGILRLWDPGAGALAHKLAESVGWTHALAFSPDGRRLASAGLDRVIRLWDVDGLRRTATLEGHTAWVNALAFSPDGRTLASADREGSVRYWDLPDGRPGDVVATGGGAVRALAFSPDGRRLATAGEDGALRFWDAASGRALATQQGHVGSIFGVAFAPSGQRLASVGQDGTVRLWEAASAAPSATVHGHAATVRAVACAPDGGQIASAGDDATVRLWDAGRGQPTTTLVRHVGWVRAVAFSADGTLLASAGEDGCVRLWPVTGDEPVAELQHGPGWVRALAFSPAADRLASAGEGGAICLWDIAERRLHCTCEGHAGGVRALAFSADALSLASAGIDGTVRLWDAGAATLRTIIRGHTGWVNAVAFSPDAKRVVSAGEDGVIRIWDATDASAAAALREHSGPVNGLAFSPDGEHFASAGEDRTICLWDAHSGDLIARLPVGVRVAAIAWGRCGLTATAHTGIMLFELRP